MKGYFENLIEKRGFRWREWSFGRKLLNIGIAHNRYWDWICASANLVLSTCPCSVADDHKLGIRLAIKSLVQLAPCNVLFALIPSLPWTGPLSGKTLSFWCLISIKLYSMREVFLGTGFAFFRSRLEHFFYSTVKADGITGNPWWTY